MKYLFLLVSVLALASCSTNEYEVEDELFDCLEKKAEKNGIDLEKEVLKLEDFYIKAGYLKSRSGKAKIEYYKSVINKSQITIPDGALETYRNVAQVVYQWEECKNGIDSKAFRSSKFGMLREKIDAMIAKDGQVSPVSVIELFVQELNAEDLEHPFFRAFALVFPGSLLMKDDSYIRKIPKKLPQTNHLVVGATMVTLDSQNVIRLNGEKKNLGELSRGLAKIIVHFKPNDNNHIRIKVSRHADYKRYLHLNEYVERGYNIVLSEYARIEFGKTLYHLTEKEKETLKENHPCPIIEVKDN